MKHQETAMPLVGQYAVQSQAEMTLEAALTWLCRQRATTPPDADICHLRYHQEVEKKTLLQQLLAGEYRLSPMQVVGRGAERRVMWCARYMDDIVILAKTRWQLRKQVRQLNQYFAQKGLRQHPDKTFIGRTSHGFDWMGAWLNDAGAQGVAPRTWGNHREKVRRLYERAWRRREAKGITRARVSAYRLRWTIWAMVLLGVSGHASSATLTAVLPAGRAGIVGATDVVSGRLAGPLDEGGIQQRYGYPALSNSPSYCRSPSDPAYRKGSTGVYGFAMTGPTEGAVLLADGAGSWTRRTAAGVMVSGQVTFNAGTWSAVVRDGSKSSTVSSRPDGTYGTLHGSGTVACPVYESPDLKWSSTFSRTSDLSVRFLIDAPLGGLSPGAYSVPAVYLVDLAFVGSGDRSILLVDTINVKVMHYGCTVVAPASVTLSSDSPGATINVAVTCSDQGSPSGAPSSGPITAWLAVAASGASAGVSADPQRLGVARSNGTLYLRGNWSSTVPSCTASDVYFDGRVGKSLGQVRPGSSSNFGVTPLSFRLCNTPDATPGQYTAQATISVVQR